MIDKFWLLIHSSTHKHTHTYTDTHSCAPLLVQLDLELYRTKRDTDE